MGYRAPYTFAAIVLVILEVQRHVLGQGLTAEMDKALGASIGSQRLLTDAYTRGIAADIRTTYRRMKSTCKGPTAARSEIVMNDCVLSSPAEEAQQNAYGAALLSTTSPSSYSSANLSWTDGVQVLLPSYQQLPCFTCTACAVASAASTAIAMVLRINVTETQVSPVDLYYCQGVSRTCTSGSTLREMLDVLQNPEYQLSDGRCRPYNASVYLSSITEGLCDQRHTDRVPANRFWGETICAENRWFPTGQFRYLRLSSQSDIMQHIRAFGAVVSQFDLYDDFKLFYNVPGNRHKVYKRSNTSEYVEGHSIMLIGYHLDATDPSKDYWVAQNSWGTHWADEGRFKVEMWFAGLAAGNTYGIIWTPSRGQYKLPVAVQPLVGLTAAGKDNCCEYTPAKYDYLSKIARLAGLSDSLEDMTRFVSANIGGVKELSSAGPITTSMPLKICNSRVCSNMVEGAVSLGCFGDNPFPARAVPHQLGPARSETYTPQKCATFAREAGYRVGAVFALGSIYECYAGNSAVRARVYGGKARSAISAQCNMRCGDDAPRSLATCGGDYAIRVYVLTDGGKADVRQQQPLALPDIPTDNTFLGEATGPVPFILSCPPSQVITAFFGIQVTRSGWHTGGEVQRTPVKSIGARCSDGTVLGPTGKPLTGEEYEWSGKHRGFVSVQGADVRSSYPYPGGEPVGTLEWILADGNYTNAKPQYDADWLQLPVLGATITDQYGGKKRYKRRLTCPKGQLISGIFGQSGDLIYHIGIECNSIYELVKYGGRR